MTVPIHNLQTPHDWRNTPLVPVLPPTVGYLLATLYDSRLNIRDLATEVERFPTIAARLLAVANSAWSSPRTPITTLPGACNRLGLNTVRSLSIALAVSNVFNPAKCPGFDGERYWATALLAAEGASLLADGMEQPGAGLIWRSAALLHNIGLLWLADHYPQQTGAVLTIHADADLLPVMRNILGTDFCQVGAWLTRAWALPEIYPSIIGHYKNPIATDAHFLAAATVGVAAGMASNLSRGGPYRPGHIPANLAGHLRPAVAERTYRSLSLALNDIRALGRMMASARWTG